jgi:hypothetical protein
MEKFRVPPADAARLNDYKDGWTDLWLILKRSFEEAQPAFHTLFYMDRKSSLQQLCNVPQVKGAQIVHFLKQFSPFDLKLLVSS